MTVTLIRSSSRCRITVKEFANSGALFVGHDGEIKIDAIDSVERNDRIRDSILDFVAQRTASNRERNLNRHDGAIDRNTADHSEVNDASV